MCQGCQKRRQKECQKISYSQYVKLRVTGRITTSVLAAVCKDAWNRQHPSASMLHTSGLVMSTWQFCNVMVGITRRKVILAPSWTSKNLAVLRAHEIFQRWCLLDGFPPMFRFKFPVMCKNRHVVLEHGRCTSLHNFVDFARIGNNPSTFRCYFLETRHQPIYIRHFSGMYPSPSPWECELFNTVSHQRDIYHHWRFFIGSMYGILTYRGNYPKVGTSTIDGSFGLWTRGATRSNLKHEPKDVWFKFARFLWQEHLNHILKHITQRNLDWFHWCSSSAKSWLTQYNLNRINFLHYAQKQISRWRCHPHSGS